MAAKLGTADVSFRLGATTPAAVYLGATQVWSAISTLYFSGSVNGEWTTVGNWWLDDQATVAAGRLPSATDNAVLLAGVLTNSGGTITVADLTIEAGDTYIAITVTGMATFNNGVAFYGTITGNATFNDTAINAGTIAGDATLNDSSQNVGTVTGSVTDNR
jgi:hypothetical protein